MKIPVDGQGRQSRIAVAFILGGAFGALLSTVLFWAKLGWVDFL
jgi:hypothetical protein